MNQTERSAAAEANDGADLAPFAHVVGHDEQHRGERGHRNEAGERRQHQHDSQQRQRVNHAGHRSLGAGANVGGRAGDGAGHGNAAEQGARDVGDALRHQFRVGVVAVAAHRVGDHGREQAFERGQNRHRQRGRQQRQDQVGAKLRNVDGRQGAADAAEFAADGFDRQVEEGGDQGCR